MATITIIDGTPGDTITVQDGPSNTTEVKQGNGLTSDFSGFSDAIIDGNNGGDKIFLNLPVPGTGLVTLTIQNLGAGSTITGVNPNAGSPDVAVATLALTAAAGIGTAARFLRTQTGTLKAVTTTTGGVFINNNAAAAGALNIGSIGAGGVQVTGASGDIALINNGTINSTSNNDTIAGPGNVTVMALGAAADVNISGQASLPSVFGAGSGLVDVEAGRDINLGGSVNNSFGVVRSTSGSVKLVAGRNLTLNANGFAVVNNGNGSINASSGGDFTMLTAPGNLPASPGFQTAGGAIALAAGPGATMTLDSTGTNAVSSAGGNIALTADAMVFNKGVNAGAGNVLLHAATAGQLISLGTALGGFNLTAADLNQVTANTLTIGDGQAGSVTVGGTATATHATNLTIDTGGSFSGKSGSSFTLAAGGGTLTIAFDLNGQGGVGDLTNTTVGGGVGHIHMIGGAGNDVLMPNPAEFTTMTGGGGLDTFESSLFGLSGDTFTDIIPGDKLYFTDGNPNTFQFSLNGTTLSYGNGALNNTLTLSNAPKGLFIESADPNGGVDLTFVIPVAVSDNAAFVDFAGTGTSDVLFRSASTGQMAYWTTQNGQISGITVLGSAPISAQLVDTGDFNGDKHPDLLFRDTNSGQIATWDTINGQISSINVLGSAPASAQIAATGDFNHDGTTDILFRDTNTGQIATWTVVNNQIQSINVLGSAPASAQIAATGDFNHDGTTDILFRDTNTGQLAYWLVQNNQLLGAPQVLGSTSADWHLVGTGDFAGNGNTDLLFANNATGGLAEWLLNGTQIQSIQAIGNVASGYHVVGTGDLNDDGRADIVFRNDAGQVATWLMNGSQLLSAQVLGSASTDLAIAIHHFNFV